MKQNLNLWSVLVALLMTSVQLSAQDTYVNERITNTTDLIGTARYVGMGGAMGALGADISVMSSNPAGIGLFRRTTFAGTLSVLSQTDKQNRDESLTHFSFDNLGVVVSLPLDPDGMSQYFNFGVNYQKKANYNHVLTANNANTFGLSQTDQFAHLSNLWAYVDDKGYTNFTSRLIGTAYNAWLFDSDAQGYYSYGADRNAFTRVTSGGLHGVDINLSYNVLDRYFFGATFGVDDLDYESSTTYSESLMQQNASGGWEDHGYRLHSTQNISGNGINIKFGTIVRPFEDSPFRVGVAVETPTYYRLESTSFYTIESPFDANGDYTPNYMNRYRGEMDNYFDYKLTTPWKFRFSMGHTIGSYLALGAEYEYADYSTTKMSYPTYDYYWGDDYWSDAQKDTEMNRLTRRTLQGVHSLKLGMEMNLGAGISLRAGFNHHSKAFKKNAYLDQDIDSYAMTFATGTDYTNLGDVNLYTAGLGYRGEHFYVDVAYKYRAQGGKFYAFDDSFTQSADYEGTSLQGMKLAPVDVDLDHHQVFLTLGYRL